MDTESFSLELDPSLPRETNIAAAHDLLWRILISMPIEIAGPAVQITLTRMIGAAVGASSDEDKRWKGIHDDISSVIQKWGAAYDPRH